MSISIKGLQNFKKKVASYKNFDNVCERVAQRIADRGSEIAQSEYGERTVDIQVIQGEAEGSRKIVAKGRGLAFDEFGTGLVGQGTYEGNLPTETIEFESPKGSPQSTQGWEYYYPNSKTKRTNAKGEQGWFHNKKFVKGKPAEAQMWKTANELENGKAVQAIKELMKERGVW